jgi:hypothetical protein
VDEAITPTGRSTAVWGLYCLVMGLRWSGVARFFSRGPPPNFSPGATIDLPHQTVKEAYADANKLFSIHVYCFLCDRRLLCTVQDVHCDVVYPDGSYMVGKPVYIEVVLLVVRGNVKNVLNTNAPRLLTRPASPASLQWLICSDTMGQKRLIKLTLGSNTQS